MKITTKLIYGVTLFGVVGKGKILQWKKFRRLFNFIIIEISEMRCTQLETNFSLTRKNINYSKNKIHACCFYPYILNLKEFELMNRGESGCEVIRYSYFLNEFLPILLIFKTKEKMKYNE